MVKKEKWYLLWHSTENGLVQHHLAGVTTMIQIIVHKQSLHQERFSSKSWIPHIFKVVMVFFSQLNMLVTVVAQSKSNAIVVQAEIGYNCYDERKTRIILVLQLIGDAAVEAIPISTTILHNFRSIWRIKIILVGHIQMLFGWKTWDAQMREHSACCSFQVNGRTQIKFDSCEELA